MPSLKIAIMQGCLRLPEEEALAKAKEMGADGVQIGSPVDLDAAGRRALVEKIGKYGLKISAVCAWGGEVDLGEEGSEVHVESGKRVLELAADLGCKIWQGHVGVMPEDTEHPHWANFVRGCVELAEHGEKVGACLALETGPEPPPVVKRLMDTVGSPALRVNYDPANLILWPPMLAQWAGVPYDRKAAWEKFMPVEGADLLGPYVVHVHAKDATTDDAGNAKEVPLGEGLVEWPKFVGYLQKHGFDGFFAIEREVGENPVKDIQTAINYLRTL